MRDGSASGVRAALQVGLRWARGGTRTGHRSQQRSGCQRGAGTALDFTAGATLQLFGPASALSADALGPKDRYRLLISTCGKGSPVPAALPAFYTPMASHRSLQIWAWALAGLFALALVAAIAYMVSRTHSEALVSLQTDMHQLADTAHSESERSLTMADLAMGQAARYLRAGPHQPRSEQELDLRRTLLQLTELNPSLLSMRVYNEQGQLLADATPAHNGTPTAPPSALIAQALAAPFDTLVAGSTHHNTAHDEWVLSVARAVPLREGRPVVVVTELVLAALLRSQASVPGQLTTLENATGQLLYSVPMQAHQLGHRAGAPIAFDATGHLAYTGPQRLLGGESISVARAISVGHLVLVSSVDLRTGLAAWREATMRRMGIAGGFGFFILLTAALAHYQLRQLQRVKSKLSSSVATLDQALSAMAEGFLLCDAQDRVVMWNKRYVEILPGVNNVVAVGMPFERLAQYGARQSLPNGSDAQRQAWVQARLHQRLTGVQSLDINTADGRQLSLLERRLPDGGMVSTYRDVTATERRLAAATQAAEQASQAKSQFLANMSHEIRTPLNAVLGLNALMLDSALQSEQRRYAELIRSSGQLLLALINDILDFSRVEAGHLQLEALPYCPQRAAQEVVALMRERAQAKSLQLVFDAPATPWPQLVGDEVRIRQILFNLVGNALKFTEQGQVQLSMQLVWAEQPALAGSAAPPAPVAWLKLRVQDSGIGMEPQVLDKLFERFTQADNSTARQYGGSGLGLAITRELVHLMGGRITATSVQGQGSCFEVDLPCTLAAPIEAPMPDSDCDSGWPTPLESHHRATGLRILVAEDNPVNQVLIQAVLDRLGHHCEIVNDGRQAVHAAQATAFDLILMDVQMPQMDGLAATAAIRKLEGEAARLPIIAMTANARREDRASCLAAGMDDYVSKPLDVAQLSAALQRAACGDRAGLARLTSDRREPAATTAPLASGTPPATVPGPAQTTVRPLATPA